MNMGGERQIAAGNQKQADVNIKSGSKIDQGKNIWLRKTVKDALLSSKNVLCNVDPLSCSN